MGDTNKKQPKEKLRLHIRNKHRKPYNFKLLIEKCKDLDQFVKINNFGTESIDFSDAKAVKTLNKALLKLHYNIEYWDIPQDYLTPPVPGRADYIHHIADLLAKNNYGKIPKGEKIKCIDIGVGANCIYPLIGNTEYGWSFIGSDIDPIAIDSANKILKSNKSLAGKIECRVQKNPKDYFYGIIRKDELIDLSICNPPFNSSKDEAQKGTLRKLNNLNKKRITKAELNFGGQANELWCEGGEEYFIRNMIHESKKFGKSVFWFSSLVSKQSNLKGFYKVLEQAKAIKVETINMGQGNKTSRIIAWTFLNIDEQKQWKNTRWKD